MFDGRVVFPFSLELFFLFFERFPTTRTSFYHRPLKMMREVHMHMWGNIIPKRGYLEFSNRITVEVLEMIGNEDDHSLDLVPYPYMGLDLRV